MSLQTERLQAFGFIKQECEENEFKIYAIHPTILIVGFLANFYNKLTNFNKPCTKE